jgi:hypothetical protein
VNAYCCGTLHHSGRALAAPWSPLGWIPGCINR